MLFRYGAMRLVQLIPMVLVVTMVVFFVMMIVPGDPVMVMLGRGGWRADFTGSL